MVINDISSAEFEAVSTTFGKVGSRGDYPARYRLAPARGAGEHCPAPLCRPAAPERYTGDDVQPPEIIEKMRVAGRLAAQAMHAAAEIISPGVTTDDLDQIVHEFMIDNGAYPSTLGYRGFPKSCCTSVNEVICHGIPDARPLEDGDIVKIDVTAYVGGVHGDTCATFFCGEVDEQTRLLTERTREALVRAINAVKPGRQVNVIGRVIESYAKRFGYGVVRDYTGHGVHTTFHSGLVIPHYDEPAYDTVIRPGHDVHDRADDHPRERRVVHVGRRLDGAHRRRESVRPVRAHAGGHGERRGSPHPSLALGWRWTSRSGDRGGAQAPLRKVRTPQSKVVGNTHPGRPAGQCHRKQTASNQQ